MRRAIDCDCCFISDNTSASMYAYDASDGWMLMMMIRTITIYGELSLANHIFASYRNAESCWFGCFGIHRTTNEIVCDVRMSCHLAFSISTSQQHKHTLTSVGIGIRLCVCVERAPYLMFSISDLSCNLRFGSKTLRAKHWQQATSFTRNISNLDIVYCTYTAARYASYINAIRTDLRQYTENTFGSIKRCGGGNGGGGVVGSEWHIWNDWIVIWFDWTIIHQSSYSRRDLCE